MTARTLRHLLGATTAALSLLTTACSEGTAPSAADEAPGTIVGVFDLARVNGNTPSTPYKTHEIEPGTVARHYVTEARIAIAPDSTLTVSETHKLSISGRAGSDMASTTVKQGKVSFEPSAPGATDNGRLRVTFSDGKTRTMELTQFTITDKRMVLGNPGQGEIPLQLIYTRK